jgi:hypothetical protein
VQQDRMTGWQDKLSHGSQRNPKISKEKVQETFGMKQVSIHLIPEIMPLIMIMMMITGTLLY